MNTYSEMLPHIESNNYELHFWNAMRGKKGDNEIMKKGFDSISGAYAVTKKEQNKYMAAIKHESLFRNFATEIRVYDTNYRIKTVNSNDVAVWVPEGASIPIEDAVVDFGDLAMTSHKLAVFLKVEESLVRDPHFNIKEHLVNRLAKNFGKGEDNGFINGTGIDAPTGILSEKGGAQVGITTSVLTFDDVIKLYFSVKAEYRKNGAWLMNDETALMLRTLKDADGNPLWNHANDTILGKKVYISEFMPGPGSGNKAIAFGDFSYYWIILRRPISIRTLTEQFAMTDHIGYLAYEFLDGKLIRPDAVKVIQITE